MTRRPTSRLAAALALAPLGTVLALAGPGDARAQPEIACEIAFERAVGGVAVVPIVHAARAAAGTYRLRLTRIGPGGRSRLSQGGSFAATPGEATRLSRAVLDGNGTLDVVLEIDVDGETLACDARHSL
ncbi:MAG: curli-like amyloid fiber formation chaperone CsgH [Salinarimonas sp.]